MAQSVSAGKGVMVFDESTVCLCLSLCVYVQQNQGDCSMWCQSAPSVGIQVQARGLLEALWVSHFMGSSSCVFHKFFSCMFACFKGIIYVTFGGKSLFRFPTWSSMNFFCNQRGLGIPLIKRHDLSNILRWCSIIKIFVCFSLCFSYSVCKFIYFIKEMDVNMDTISTKVDSTISRLKKKYDVLFALYQKFER